MPFSSGNYTCCPLGNNSYPIFNSCNLGGAKQFLEFAHDPDVNYPDLYWNFSERGAFSSLGLLSSCLHEHRLPENIEKHTWERNYAPMTFEALDPAIPEADWPLDILYIDFRGREGGGERETSICCSTYVCIPWLLLVRALTRDQTYNFGVPGWCCNQLSYPTRTQVLFKQWWRD